MKKKKNAFQLTTLLFIAAAMLAVYASLTALDSGGGGEIFFQVHFSNKISSVTSDQLKKILSAEVNNFSSVGGKNIPVRIYADKRISQALRSAYPALRFAVTDFTKDESSAADNSFFGISDSAGKSVWHKTLRVDGASPLGRIMSDMTLAPAGDYPWRLKGAARFNAERHIVIVQTGVTAMTRAFLSSAECSRDPLYPVRFTMPITRGADFAVTSNEVSFRDPCVYPFKDRMKFCSPVKYFRLLEESGFDAVELTGNHNNDYGHDPNLKTMKMIRAGGMNYFGGGINTEDAERPLAVKIKSSTFVFAGYNQPGPEYAFAGKDSPGAAKFDEKQFASRVSAASAMGEFLFVSLQSTNENDPIPWRDQRRIFRTAIDNGAVIAVSSSAHRAMGVEFYAGRFISYGLGNFLFDQMQTINHRRGLIARYHFHEGRHIETELIAYIIYEYCQPRLASGGEADALMDYVFAHSLGPVFGR